MWLLKEFPAELKRRMGLIGTDDVATASRTALKFPSGLTCLQVTQESSFVYLI